MNLKRPKAAIMAAIAIMGILSGCSSEKAPDGAVLTADAVERGGKYTRTVKNVSENQTVEAYFAGAAVPKEALAALVGALDLSRQGDYTESLYSAFTAAKSYAEAVLRKSDAYQCDIDSSYRDLF